VLRNAAEQFAVLPDTQHDGTPAGLLFPASMVIVGDQMYVTDTALPLTPAIGDEPEEDVTRWTLSRMKVPNR